MPKMMRKQIDFTYEGLKGLLQYEYDKLEMLRIKGERDYNKINNIQSSATDIITLDNAKNNAVKLIVNYFEKKNEILKMVKDVILSKDKIENSKDGTNTEVNTQEDKLKLQKLFQEFKKAKVREDVSE